MNEYKINSSIIDHKCRAIVQNGKNKGQQCRRKYKCKGYFCQQHYKSIYRLLHRGGNCS